MSAFRPRTTKTGGLPNISFIIRKPEPLGTEFKDTACKKVRGAIKHLELQRGKMGMRSKEYCAEMGATAACTLRMCEAGRQEMAEGERAGIKGDAWFGSVVAADELGSRGMEAVCQVSSFFVQFHSLYITNNLLLKYRLKPIMHCIQKNISSRC